MRRLSAIVIAAALISSCGAVCASTLDGVVAESMVRSLLEAGVSEERSAEITSRYSFLGVMMARKDGTPDEAIQAASASGESLGRVLAAVDARYGIGSMYEAASVMLLASRAGMMPDAASSLFISLSEVYGIDEVSEIVARTSEYIRSNGPTHDGRDISEVVVSMASSGEASSSEVLAVVAHAYEEAQAHRARMIAERERIRRALDSKGGGEGRSSGSGGGGDSGGGGASAAGSSGSDSDGSSSSGGDAGGASGSGGSSGAGDGSDSGSSGGDSGSSDGGSSGGDSGGDSSDGDSNGGGDGGGSSDGDGPGGDGADGSSNAE